MCLIVAKPAGIAIPKISSLNDWFHTHSDGMGIAFKDPTGFIRILKGGMTTLDMFTIMGKAQEYVAPLSLSDVDMVIHFRQATEGSICPANTHPYPVVADEKSLSSINVLTDVALAHNGIIWDYSTYTKGKWQFNTTSNKTDTQSFIEEHLVGLGKSLWNESVQSLIEVYTDSKFALLSKRGITYIGKFISDGGLQFSNGTYTTPRPTVGVVEHYPEQKRLNLYGAGSEDVVYDRMFERYDGRDDGTRMYMTQLSCDNCGDWFEEKELTDCGDSFLCPPCAQAYIDAYLGGDKGEV